MSEQRRLNAEVWSAATDGLRREYGRAEVRPVERLLVDRHGEELGGRVLELGVGAGRLTRLLAEHASELHGIDISPVMVEHCRRAIPGAHFAVGDIADLGRFAGGALDAIVAGYNVIDVLDHDERNAALAEWARVLRPGGLLVVSSHNLAYADRIARPWDIVSRHPGVLARNVLRLPRRLRNHRRLAALETSGDGWAIRNDEAHDFSLLHYYVSTDGMRRQLAERGLETVACLDLAGSEVSDGPAAGASPELHYVARRATS
jgi:SAM-dependent methyltransferase